MNLSNYLMRIMALIAMTMFIIACGKAGPLYLPQDTQGTNNDVQTENIKK